MVTVRWAVLAVGVALVVLVAASPATALSCVGHEDASAAAILAGEERLGTLRDFDEDYRGAVLGTVTDVDTDEREGSATHGATTVHLEVHATYGDVGAESVRIEMSDPGWMSGYPFEVGTTYFVPIRHEPNAIMGCEPITPVAPDEVDGLVAQLDEPAPGVVLTVGSERISVVPAASGEGDDGGLHPPAWLWVALAGVLVAGAVAVTAIVGRD
ncbi:hypothetical protein [Egicoccus sp. AB-alg6-2]|uniref:hypothetical protein n=1 Tax=Egicoccus sp. AB-alg6-2 TaxID=3242692 RepID=UPI00359ED677